jgi:uncharacterized protein with von Willebrand factor type A (vWA) domain
VSGAAPDPVGAAVGFAARLRAEGLRVPVSAVVVYVRALAAVGLASPSSAYWAGRATLVSDPADLEAYDRAFGAFWLGRPPPARQESPAPPVPLGLDAGPGRPPAPVPEPEPALAVRYSPLEVLRSKDFAECSPEELAECYRLMARVRLGGALRKSRRLRASPRARGRPDGRATVRRALRTGGEVLEPAGRRRHLTPRRVVLVLDVSGSMDPYARALLRFAHAAVSGRSRVQAFALGTRLTAITRQLGWRDPDAALQRVAQAAPDRAGGTRLGEGIARLNRMGAPRGAVVVVASDGWDRGDPDLLDREMARLHRLAHRVVWVNPLRATPGYAPLARGMAAALPHVDHFVDGHSLSSLEHLAEVVAG